MELKDYMRTMAKRWRLVAVCALLGLCAAAGLTLVTQPTYQARTQLFVSLKTDPANLSTAFQGTTFTQQRVKSYAAIIDSPKVLQPVITTLGLSTTPEALAAKVSASVPVDTNLISVYVDDSDPGQAARTADAVSAEFSKYVSGIEQSDVKGDSLVKISVVRAAEVPTTPVSPRPKLNLVLGLLLGLVVGVGLAVLRENLDTSIKSESDIEEIGKEIAQQLTVIGSIGKDPDAPKRPLIVQADPRGPRAEAFRQLRTNLQFVDVDNPPRTIVITSSVPQEGKSTTAANLAITLAQAGLRVALVEADLRRPKLAGYMGLENAVGLTDVLVGRAKLPQMLQTWGQVPLDVLPSGRPAPNPSELLGSHAMLTVIRELEATHDIVLLDAPPLLPVTDAAVMSALAGGALLVIRAGKTTHDQVTQAIESLHAVDARLLGVVLTMVPSRGRTAYEYGYEYPNERGRRGRRGKGKGSAPEPDLDLASANGKGKGSSKVPSSNGAGSRPNVTVTTGTGPSGPGR